MSSRRCSTCGINWPPASGAKCAVCLGKTDSMTNAVPIDAETARSLTAHAAFGRYLESETPERRRVRRAKYARDQADRDLRFAAITSHL